MKANPAQWRDVYLAFRCHRCGTRGVEWNPLRWDWDAQRWQHVHECLPVAAEEQEEAV